MLKHHGKLERHSWLMLIGIVIMISIGGIIEIVPLFRLETTIEKVEGMRPYTPLELAGFNVYIREGCYNCHSQQIRSLRDEVERYGHYSLAAESMYDHPFQWGSKRTGPDLARVGGKYSDEWHVAHLVDPRSVVPESIMPKYGFLLERPLNLVRLKKDLQALRVAGVPYTDDMIANAKADAQAQAAVISDTSGLLARYGKNVTARDFDTGAGPLGHVNGMVTEMDALVAYMQRLGNMVDFSTYNPDVANNPAAGTPTPEATQEKNTEQPQGAAQ